MQEQLASQLNSTEGNTTYSGSLDFEDSPIWNTKSSQLRHHEIGPEASRGFTGIRGELGYMNQRRTPEDRPKSKHIIPGCSPWVLVKTRLGRRFVYNPEARQSYWKFPPDVMKCVIEFDRLEREKRERTERGELNEYEHDDDGQTAALERAVQLAETASVEQASTEAGNDDEGDEFEEVEVTDDDDDDDEENEYAFKRQKTEELAEQGPVEFDEDDIAYQLAAMGQEYGLDPGEYGEDENGDWEEGAEDLPLTEEDSKALFMDMLNDHHINPYTPWEKLIGDGKIIEDDRYTCLPNMKSRREVWTDWTRNRMQQLKEQREKQEKKDPKIPYFAFLQSNATPKLYWPEFRRKFKKEPVMRDSKVNDKDREKWYREYINRKFNNLKRMALFLTRKLGLKLPESTLKSDLSAALKALPIYALNRSTDIQALPPALLTDIRYISLRPEVRDPLIEAFIAIAPAAPEKSDITPGEEAELAMEKMERERREKALAERERRVQEEKRRQQYALRQSKGMLREGEEEIERAMHVGREGLLSHLVPEQQAGSSKKPVEVEPSSS